MTYEIETTIKHDTESARFRERYSFSQPFPKPFNREMREYDGERVVKVDFGKKESGLEKLAA